MKNRQRELAEQSARACRQTSSQYWRGVCQVCVLRTGKADRRGSFSYHPNSGWYQCFKCAVCGFLGGDARDRMPREVEAAPEMRAPEGFYELARGEGAGARSLEPARAYLRSRGLKDETLWRTAHLGACVVGFYANRVVVPVLSPEADWLGFVARAWTKKADIPYLYPKGMARRDVVYNHAALLEETDEPVFVVEGVMDALALWPNAVALLGKASETQVWALADAPRPIAICLDGDAWREGEELAMRLQLEGQRAGNIRLPPKTDPDEVDRKWLEEEASRALL